MEGIEVSAQGGQPTARPEVFYLDGCKVTVRYSGGKNPAVVKIIKDTLISNGTTRKS